MPQVLPNVTTCQSAIVSADLPGAATIWQPNDMGDTFGARLRHAMDLKRWNQKTLAAHVRLTEPAVSRHLGKVVAPRTRETIESYCAALGVNAEWLAKGTGEMKAGAAPAESCGAPPVGRDALEQTLSDYPWPLDLDVSAMDAICAETREEASTPAGALRPMSVWRAAIEQRTARMTTRSAVLPRAAKRG